jgi:hypothetical protein
MNPPSKKAIFILIYSYKFPEFLWNLYELDEFKRFADVQVWDISTITTPKLSKGLAVGRSTRNEVITCGSMRDYVRRLFDLRKQAADTNICVLNGVHWFLPVEALCNLFLIFILKGKNIKAFDTYNGGCPVVYPKDNKNDYISQQRPGFFSMLTRFISRQTTLTQAWRSICGAFLFRLSKIVPTVLTHRLVAGEQWLSLAMKDQRSGIRNVYCHSCDFSRYLLAEKASFSGQGIWSKTAVFLSSATPMFGGDIILSGGDHGFTSEVWYPALVRFFNFLESNTGVTVEVAGHYQSAFPAIAPCFGNRSVHYEKTLELMQFLTPFCSTSLSFLFTRIRLKLFRILCEISAALQQC